MCDYFLRPAPTGRELARPGDGLWRREGAMRDARGPRTELLVSGFFAGKIAVRSDIIRKPPKISHV